MISSSDRRISKPALMATDSVIVIGGRGFVGSQVVRVLLDGGIDVHVLGPPMSVDLLADRHGRFGDIDCGVEDAVAVRAALERLTPAALVVCSAWGADGDGLMRAGEANPDRAFEINVDAMRRLLELAHECGVRQVVWTSSTTVFGEAGDYRTAQGIVRVDEDAPKRPATIYGLTKHLAEEVAVFAMRRHRLAVIGIRLPLVLGPGLWYRGAATAFADLFAAARLGAEHRMVMHDEPIDLMHVDDAARALLVVLRHEGVLGPVYHVNGFTARASEVVAMLRTRRPGLEIGVEVVAPVRSFPLVDDARFRADTGFIPAFDLARVVDDALSRGTAG